MKQTVALLLFAGSAILAQDKAVPTLKEIPLGNVITKDDQIAFWQRSKILSDAQGSLEATFTDKQKQILAQIDQLRQQVDAALKKASEGCAAGVDLAQLKKNLLACVPPAKDGK